MRNLFRCVVSSLFLLSIPTSRICQDYFLHQVVTLVSKKFSLNDSENTMWSEISSFVGPSVWICINIQKKNLYRCGKLRSRWYVCFPTQEKKKPELSFKSISISQFFIRWSFKVLATFRNCFRALPYINIKFFSFWHCCSYFLRFFLNIPRTHTLLYTFDKHKTCEPNKTSTCIPLGP